MGPTGFEPVFTNLWEWRIEPDYAKVPTSLGGFEPPAFQLKAGCDNPSFAIGSMDSDTYQYVSIRIDMGMID